MLIQVAALGCCFLGKIIQDVSHEPQDILLVGTNQQIIKVEKTVLLWGNVSLHALFRGFPPIRCMPST